MLIQLHDSESLKQFRDGFNSQAATTSQLSASGKMLIVTATLYIAWRIFK